MSVYRAIPGIEVRPVSAVRVVIARGAAPPMSDAVRREWEKRCERTPRLFDGPILSVLGFDEERGELHCRRDGYARLTVQPAVHTGVRLLAVTGLITARDATGREHVLVGRRGEGTRIYGGMWELAPSGGLAPPGEAVTELGEPALAAQVHDELEEELGRSFPLRHARAVALVRDAAAFSEDVVVACDAGALEDVDELGGATWEYSETRWVARDTWAAFEASHPVIDATRATLAVVWGGNE